MATGTITTNRAERGFGFLAPDEGGGRGDLFFHHTALAEGGFDRLQEGQRVSYEEGADPRDPRRKRAVNVNRLDEASS